MTASAQGIAVEHVGMRSNIAVVRLDRPERKNAFDAVMARRLCEVLAVTLRNSSLGAVIITGTGDRFSPGADSVEALELAREAAKGRYPKEPFGGLLRAMQEATLALYESDKLTIAAMNGSAAAGALDLALACDLRIAARGSRFAQSYVKLCLPPLNAGAWLMRRAVGEANALRLLLSGEAVTDEHARDIGLVHELVDPGEALPRATALAEAMITGPSTVREFIKREVRCGATTSLADAQTRAFSAGVAAINSDEYRSAVEAALAGH